MEPARTILQRLDDYVATIRNDTLRYCADKTLGFITGCKDRMSSVFSGVFKTASRASTTSSWGARKVFVSFCDMPFAARRRFFPRSAEKIKTRLDQITKMPLKDITSAVLRGNVASRLDNNELLALFNLYLDSRKKLPLEKVKDLRKWMGKIAEAENLQEVEKYHVEIKRLFTDLTHTWNKDLQTVVTLVIQAFKEPHELVSTQVAAFLEKPSLEEKDLRLLLKTAEALKDEEIANKIHSMKPITPLVQTALKKLQKVELDVLKRLHHRELVALEKSSKELAALEKYCKQRELSNTNSIQEQKSTIIGEVDEELLANEGKRQIIETFKSFQEREIAQWEQLGTCQSSYLKDTKKLIEGFIQEEQEQEESEINEDFGGRIELLRNNPDCALPIRVFEKKLPFQKEILARLDQYETKREERKSGWEELSREVDQLKDQIKEKLEQRDAELKINPEADIKFYNQQIKSLEAELLTKEEERQVFIKEEQKAKEAKEEFSFQDVPKSSQVQDQLYEASRKFFHSIGDTQELVKPLEQWHMDLQKIWQNHLSIEAEKRILAKKRGKERQEEMSLSFSDWVLETTGESLKLSLEKFANIQIEDRSKQRLVALKKLQGPILEYAKKREAKTKAILKEEVSEKHAISFENVKQDSEEYPLIFPETSFNPSTISGPLPHADTDLVQILQESIQRIENATTIEEKTRAVLELHKNKKLEGMSEKKLYLLSTCHAIIDQCYSSKESVPDELQTVFVAMFDAKCLKNERYFSFFIKMLTAGLDLDQEIRVTLMQKRYLMQINALSDHPLPLKIVEADGMTTFSSASLSLLENLAKAVQSSCIGLEGLESGVLEYSFQEAGDVHTVEQRTYLDSLRARSDVLKQKLFSYVLERNRVDQHEENAAIFRALMAISQQDAEGKAFVRRIIEKKIKTTDCIIDLETLAPSESLFYRDCAAALGIDISGQDLLQEFNQTLMESCDANCKLLGFAREIVRLTTIQQNNPSNDVWFRLLKVKIGYQALREQSFTGKLEIVGFLKNAVDQAENALVEMSSFIPEGVESRMKEPLENFIDCVLSRVEGSNPKSRWVFKDGCLTYGKDTIFCASGSIYRDGTKCRRLPPELENHPDIRLLKLQGVPVSEQSGCFIYSSQDADGRPVPQLRIFRDGLENVVIQKRQPVDFQNPPTVAWVQFVPERKFDGSIPLSLACRMNIEQFWQDEEGRFYAYDKQGCLVATLKDQEIRTKDQTYIAFGDKDKKLPASLSKRNTSLYESLQKIVSKEDILIAKDGQSLWVPMLDCKFISQESYWKKVVWTCSGPNMRDLVVDTKDQGTGFLSLYLAKDSKRVREAEDNVLILERRLKRKQDIVSPSLEIKHQITKLQQELSKQKEKLAALIGKTCLVVSQDQKDAQTSSLTAHVGDLDTTPLWQQYQKALREVNLWLADNVQKSLDPQQQSEYLEKEKLYTDLKEEYRKIYGSSACKFFFSEKDNIPVAKDLNGVLFLIQKDDNRDSKMSYYIEQLARYPQARELDSLSLQLLETALVKAGEGELKLYLQAMLVQHRQYEIESWAHRPLNGKEEEAKEVLELFSKEKESLATSTKSGSFDNLHLQALLKRVDPSLVTEKEEEEIESKEAESSLLLAKEINILGQRSLLERLHIQGFAKPLRKQKSAMISKDQEKFIDEFKKTSPDQVAGFYFEEFGLFQKSALYSEFQISEKKPEGLFSLTKERMDRVFTILQDNKTFELLESKTWYGVGHSADFHPLTEVDSKEIKVYLEQEGIARQDVEKIVQRLQVFVSRAANSGFNFAFQDAKAQKKTLDALAQEKSVHFEKMLIAQDFMMAHLPPNKTIADLKYAVLTGEGQDQFENFHFLQNALIGYLIHKTEWQHIQNIEKAPLTGERNQIELLCSKRQYSTSLLLKKAAGEDELQEQRIQRAFLFFEEDYGFRCNALQHKLFRSLLLDAKSPEAIDAVQARMGFGKTALLPIMTLVQVARNHSLPEQEKYLPTYIVPRAVIEDNTLSFNNRLSNILGSHVVQDQDFPRYQLDPNSYETSFAMIALDLQKRLNFYNQVKKDGLVLIQWPEIRGSLEAQELEFGRMLVSEKLSPEVAQKCMECKILLGKIRSIRRYQVFDELDDTQDFKSRKVNYTCGEKVPMEIHSILHLEKMLACIKADMSEEELFVAMCEALEVENNAENKKAVIDPKTVPQKDDKILLMRALLQDPYMIALAKSKQPKTHFGVRFFNAQGKKQYSYDAESQSALLIAVPYDGADTPKGLSIFDNTEVTAITTMRYYASSETSFEKDPHFDFLLSQIKQNSLCPEVKAYADPSCLQELEKISRMLDGGEFLKAKEKFYQKHMQNPTAEFRKFFGLAVCATQIRSNLYCAKSDRYELGSRHNIMKGCSGTLGSTSSYFGVQQEDPAADGKLSLEIFGRDMNAGVALLKQVQGTNYLQGVLQDLLSHANKNTRAIIDAAGLCKSRDGTPEGVVKELWDQLQKHDKIRHIQGIIYYGKDNVKRIYRGPDKSPELCTTEKELEALKDGISYFSFYGQKNTRGSDIKQARGAHALITLDENVSNSDAKQAALRFRDLVSRDSGQVISFAVTNSLGNTLKKKDSSITAKTIAIYLRNKEKTVEQQDVFTIFKQEMSAHVKQVAAEFEHAIVSDPSFDVKNSTHREAYAIFLTEREKIDAFAEKAVLELQEKYGNAILEGDRSIFIQTIRKGALEKITQLKSKAEEFSRLVEIEHYDGEEIERFYKDKVSQSVDQFICRYRSEKVKISSSADTNNEAIAVSEALAESMAQAEVLALALQENQVEVQAGNSPVLTMTQRKCPEVDFAFLQDLSRCTKVKDFSRMSHVIHEQMRDQFYVSPCIKTQGASSIEETKLSSQFVLFNGSCIVFITQQEAAAFSLLDDKQGWALKDLREDQEEALCQSAQIATLQKLDPGIVNNPALQTTRELAQVALQNAPNKDLYPTLANTNKTDLDPWFDTSKYGVFKEGRLNCEIDPKSREITFSMSTRRHSLKVPFGNAAIDAMLGGWRSLSAPKAQNALKQIRENYAKDLNQLNEIKAKKEAQRKIIQSVQAFTLTNELREGLKMRDAERYYWDWVGPKFIQAAEKMAQCQKALESPNAGLQELQNLKRAIDEFIGKETLEQALLNNKQVGAFTNKAPIPLFDRGCIRRLSDETLFDYSFPSGHNSFQPSNWWEKENTKKIPPFDLVYGRILYSVHEGILLKSKLFSAPGAADCPKLDCNQMFNKTLPELVRAVNTVNDSINQIQKLEQEIKRLEESMKEPLEAIAFFEQLEAMDREIISGLRGEGICFTEEAEGFFDRVHLEKFVAASAGSDRISAQLEWKLPQYRHVVEDFNRYEEQKILPLSQQEKDVLTGQRSFLGKICQLAARVEKRT